MREKTGRIAALQPRCDPVGARPPALAQSRANRRRPPRRRSAVRRPTPVPSAVARPRGQRASAAREPTPRAAGADTCTAPISNRRGRTPSSGRRDDASGGDRRCAAEAAAQPTQRVRKAREDEGRGFGQGLISEKSLDEVILAYLSEDADDK